MPSHDANDLLCKKWSCPLPQATFLLIHGLGAHSGRWEEAARFFLEKNYSSYALELRGFGDTTGPRGHIDTFSTYLQDIRCLARAIRRSYPQKKIFLVGESLGGLIAFLFAAKFSHDVDGLVCLSAAFKSRLKFSFPDYARMIAGLFTNPRKPWPMPFDAAMCTRDPAFQKIIDADKKGYRVATPKMLFNIFLAQISATAQPINVPVLFQLGSDQDSLVDAKEIKKIFQRLRAKDKKIIQYPDMRHALSVDLGREKVFSDIVAWADKKITGDRP